MPVEAASRFLVKRPASSGSSWAPDALASGLEPLAGGQVELEFSPPGGSPHLNCARVLRRSVPESQDRSHIEAGSSRFD